MMDKLMIFMGGTELEVSGGPSRVAWVFEGLAGLRQDTSWGSDDQEELWREILPSTAPANRTGLLELCLADDESVQARVRVDAGILGPVEWVVDGLYALPRYSVNGIAPTILTDRFGEWNKEAHSMDSLDHMQPLMTALLNEYGVGLGKRDELRFWMPNDPRKLLQAGQVSSVLAYFRGQVGIWTEAEVCFDVDAVMDGEDSPEVREECAKTLTTATLPLRDQFPGTHYFLVEGDAAILGEMSICGFTPLPGQATLAFDISGPAAEQIGEIEDILVQLP